MSFSETIALKSPTGAFLSVNLRLADTSPRGVLQINHGLAEHSARYARFAEFLGAHGFHSYAHDHRGHGFTKAPDAPLGRFSEQDGAGKVIADTHAVHGHIAARHPGLPVIVFGHSMGGLIAANYVRCHPEHVCGAAIWNANFSAGMLGRLARAILAWEAFRMGSDVPSRVLPRLTFQAWGESIAAPRTTTDWLSHDAAEVDAYIDDPLCGWAPSISMWRDVFDLIFAGADIRKYQTVPRDIPINLVGGAEDPATDGGKAVARFAQNLRQAGFSTLVSRIYPETRHESLNELNRNITMQDLVNWLDLVIPAR